MKSKTLIQEQIIKAKQELQKLSSSDYVKKLVLNRKIEDLELELKLLEQADDYYVSDKELEDTIPKDELSKLRNSILTIEVLSDMIYEHTDIIKDTMNKYKFEALTINDIMTEMQSVMQKIVNMVDASHDFEYSCNFADMSDRCREKLKYTIYNTIEKEIHQTYNFNKNGKNKK